MTSEIGYLHEYLGIEALLLRNRGFGLSPRASCRKSWILLRDVHLSVSSHMAASTLDKAISLPARNVRLAGDSKKRGLQGGSNILDDPQISIE